MRHLIIAALAATALTSTAFAQVSGGEQALPSGFKATPVLKATRTAGEAPFQYPKTERPEIVSVIGELEPGGRTALHQHPVPVFVYVLEGTLAVQAEGGRAREYKAGQAFVEDVNHTHQAFNKTDAPTRILVVFAGEEGKPTTVNVK
jgi:quercetin dioxygenase-like cupin family protein